MNGSKKIYTVVFPAVLVATLLLCIFFIDLPLERWFYRFANPGATRFANLLAIIFLPWIHLILWPTVFFLAAYLFGYRKARIALDLTLALAVSLAAVELLKMFFGRARPELLFSQGISGFTFFSLNPAFFSFPSAHAATVASLGLSLFPRKPLFVFVISFFVSLSRLVLLKHFLSDILLGICLTFYVTRYVQAKTVQKKSLIFSSKFGGI